MAGDSGDDSSEEDQMKIKCLNKVEKDLFDKFQNQIKGAHDVIRTWIDICQEYEKYSRQDLLAHYMVLENHMIKMLNTNKAENKQHSDHCRGIMSGRRGDIRKVWHKERENFSKVDQIMQMKVDTDIFNKMMDETKLRQEDLHKKLALLEQVHGMEDLT
jgi:hypothetical protein